LSWAICGQSGRFVAFIGLGFEELVMKPHRWVLLAILIVAAILSYRCVQWLRWRERADSATGVALELRPARQVIKVGERPELTVTIVNRGDQEVMLVEPGDGSDCGWQTPLIEWSRRRWFRGPRCGNTNGLKPEEVFVLKPGESRQLDLLHGKGRQCYDSCTRTFWQLPLRSL
jgi:hypothetical protein